MFALHHDGHTQPALRILANGQFYTISSMHFDGIRLRAEFHYWRWNPNIITLYMESPSHLYSIKGIHPIEPSYEFGDVTKALTIDSVEPKRDLERMTLLHGSKYTVGRIGAEIAYCVATDFLGFPKVVLNEPSRGGKDLHTQRKSMVIQSRLLTKTQFQTIKEASITLRHEMYNLVRKLGQDFVYNPSARKEYAILSYLRRSGLIGCVINEVRCARD